MFDRPDEWFAALDRFFGTLPTSECLRSIGSEPQPSKAASSQRLRLLGLSDAIWWMNGSLQLGRRPANPEGPDTVCIMAACDPRGLDGARNNVERYAEDLGNSRRGRPYSALRYIPDFKWHIRRRRKPMPPTRKRAPAKRAKPKTIDEYLAAASDDKRAALEKLRNVIRAAAQNAEECISYQLPAFRQNGMLVAFGATANHCAFYPMSACTVEAHKDELRGYETSKGTIRFQADKPLPVALVRKLVRARLAENLGRSRQSKQLDEMGRRSSHAVIAARRPARPARASGPSAESRSVDGVSIPRVSAQRIQQSQSRSSMRHSGARWTIPDEAREGHDATIDSRPAVGDVLERASADARCTHRRHPSPSN